ncbi:dephospho-CoA kinase [Catonella morbi ATCC 51271]|uniref:Dephospho-CoA kinase n=1 Tax=Catonella morbi ATCC 51271 TaxID=592026 RepID=V2Y9T7_9FIRM|nr:dephospho-CoA kinase [Catonella morbi]ESL04436.1 dephospho-CoA kinase [Catonella morbi ATCC 51271]
MVIGITGGIGSGKSVVTSLLRDKFDAAVIDTDTIGHEVMEIGKSAYKKVVEIFGNKVIAEDGSIDRKKLGSLVFDNRELLCKLNDIIHPAVEAEVDKRIAEFTQKKYKYIALETALLIKVRYNRKCDKVWFVYADKDIRLKRLYDNRGIDKGKAGKIFESQNTEEEFRQIADDVIDNSGSEAETEIQIKNILESY